MFRLLWMALIFSPAILAQSVQENFLVDKSKPFVYIVFERRSTENPQFGGDDPHRLFLRVINNCSIPIRFTGSTANPGPGILVDHDVLPEPELSGEAIVLPPDTVKSLNKDRESALKRMPEGQSAHLGESFRLDPGQSLLVNLPRNHVSPYWFTKIGFDFVLEPSPHGPSPSMSIFFTEQDIPFSKR
jgi:hypothetical protein